MKNNMLNPANLFILLAFVFYACGSGVKTDEKPVDMESLIENQPEVHGLEVKAGEFDFTAPISMDMVNSGQKIYDLKCQACHKLTDERIVGPGWAGITKKRDFVWIMNMITNVEVMLETDEEAQKLLELCLVRMPNQNVSKQEARDIVEFMRKNDGEK
jgi:cytochrome c5